MDFFSNPRQPDCFFTFHTPKTSLTDSDRRNSLRKTPYELLKNRPVKICSTVCQIYYFNGKGKAYLFLQMP